MGTEHSRPHSGEQSTSKAGNAESRPFGDPATARIFVIGHDPRLQRGDAQAERVFFMDYLDRPRPSVRSEARKYELAAATVEYVRELTGGQVPRERMYFTNLCNEFLPHAPRGSTVLIPDEAADRGIAEIEKALARSKPQVIIPMSLQVFYHLARSGFVAMEHGERERFLRKAAPIPSARDRGAYASTGRAPFLEVCGSAFWHSDVPVVPVLHVKSWASRRHREAYESTMQNAVVRISGCIAS